MRVRIIVVLPHALAVGTVTPLFMLVDMLVTTVIMSVADKMSVTQIVGAGLIASIPNHGGQEDTIFKRFKLPNCRESSGLPSLLATQH